MEIKKIKTLYRHAELVSAPHVLNRLAKQIADLAYGMLKQVQHDG
ncbi:hypothetical protein SNE26_00150 [Mucilaginibacter sp. cycad4]|nr:hypothetical protein [Mucilaginibacter gossypii]WPV00177.1 hypothetical protein SNE26_00150 [Mucilaginibacter gossypii]